MIDDDKYEEMINGSPFLTDCQKKEFIYLRSNADSEYVYTENKKKIATFVHEYMDNIDRMSKLAQLIYSFSKDANVVNRIIDQAKKNKSMTDLKIAKSILNKLRLTLQDQGPIKKRINQANVTNGIIFFKGYSSITKN